MACIYTMLENSRKTYEAMTDAKLISAMDDHMHLDVDPVEEGIVDEDGALADRDEAIRELLRADERELKLLGYGYP